jgi:hypothetical protein
MIGFFCKHNKRRALELDSMFCKLYCIQMCSFGVFFGDVNKNRAKKVTVDMCVCIRAKED